MAPGSGRRSIHGLPLFRAALAALRARITDAMEGVVSSRHWLQTRRTRRCARMASTVAVIRKVGTPMSFIRVMVLGASADTAKISGKSSSHEKVIASPSAVEGYLGASGDRGSSVPTVVMGPTTADAVRVAGLSVLAQAQPSTLEGLVAALLRALGPPEASAPPPAGLTPRA